MTLSNIGGNNVEPPPSQWFHQRESLISLFVVLFAVAFNLYRLYPEVAGDVRYGNDMVMHLVMVDAVVEAIHQGLEFTDPWQGTMGMGFPLFHYYQHLPHITIAIVHVLTLGVFPLAEMLRWTTYLLLSLFPLSIYWSLGRFGFDRITSAMGGLVASLSATNSIYGFGFASYVFSGYGLYTQLWAMLLLPPALALGYRVLRYGRGYFWATLLLAATLMAHLLYGYIAFLTLGILTFIQPIRGANPKSLAEAIWMPWRRLIILFLLVVVVTSYFLVPLVLNLDYFNRSIWDESTKFDSWGHSAVLSGLVNGDLFDFGRLPSLTYLAFVGLVICLFRWREERYLVPVAIFLLWLLLYFGRSTWGPSIDVLPMMRYLHMHRFIGGVHLGGILLMAVALAVPWRWAFSRASGWYVAAALTLTILVLFPVYSERITYLERNNLGLREIQQGLLGVDSQDFDALLERLKQLPPGRVYAGPQSTADTYYVANKHPYDLLHVEGLDMMGTVYYRFSLNSDVLVRFNERRLDHYNLFNVRYVVAPEDRNVPEFALPIQQFGRHVLYQVETTGYFDLVGSDLTFAGGKTDFYPAASSWLASELPEVKQHPMVFLGDHSQDVEAQMLLSEAMGVISEVKASAGPSRGTVRSEVVGSNYFAADITVERESMLLLKATYHPNWQATVDGVKTDTVMLMPSFVGVQLPPGAHKVRIEYRSSRLRIILLSLGLITLPLIAMGEKRATALSSWFSTGLLARISVKRPRSTKRRQRRRRP